MNSRNLPTASITSHLKSMFADRGSNPLGDNLQTAQWAGKHLSKTAGELVDGSPSIALNVVHGFHECHFIDANGYGANALCATAAKRCVRLGRRQQQEPSQ
ncbi:MAG: hypothetical protein WCA10_03180 [Terracidiphilus sp.]